MKQQNQHIQEPGIKSVRPLPLTTLQRSSRYTNQGQEERISSLQEDDFGNAVHSNQPDMPRTTQPSKCVNVDKNVELEAAGLNFYGEGNTTGVNIMDLSGVSAGAVIDNGVEVQSNSNNVQLIYQDSEQPQKHVQLESHKSSSMKKMPINQQLQQNQFTVSGPNNMILNEYNMQNVQKQRGPGLRINKISTQNAKKQSIQRIYDNKNLYKQYARHLSQRRQTVERQMNTLLTSTASNTELHGGRVSNKVAASRAYAQNEYSYNQQQPRAVGQSKSTQRGGGRKVPGGPQLNTISAVQTGTRQSQSHTRGGQRMQTLRPGAKGDRVGYESNINRSFVNSYGQVTLRGTDDGTFDRSNQATQNMSQSKQTLRAKSNYRTQRVTAQGTRDAGHSRQNASKDTDGLQASVIDSNLMTLVSVDQQRPLPVVATSSHITSNKKLKSLVQIQAAPLQPKRGPRERNTGTVISGSTQNTGPALVPMTRVLGGLPIQSAVLGPGTFTKNDSLMELPGVTKEQMAVNTKKGVASGLDVSGMTQFSQVSPERITKRDQADQSLGQINVVPMRDPPDLGIKDSMDEGKKEISLYQNALSAAIQQDRQMLEGIQKDWKEINQRMAQRSNLLQTLQSNNEDNQNINVDENVLQGLNIQSLNTIQDKQDSATVVIKSMIASQDMPRHGRPSGAELSTQPVPTAPGGGKHQKMPPGYYTNQASISMEAYKDTSTKTQQRYSTQNPPPNATNLSSQRTLHLPKDAKFVPSSGRNISKPQVKQPQQWVGEAGSQSVPSMGGGKKSHLSNIPKPYPAPVVQKKGSVKAEVSPDPRQRRQNEMFRMAKVYGQGGQQHSQNNNQLVAHQQNHPVNMTTVQIHDSDQDAFDEVFLRKATVDPQVRAAARDTLNPMAQSQVQGQVQRQYYEVGAAVGQNYGSKRQKSASRTRGKKGGVISRVINGPQPCVLNQMNPQIQTMQVGQPAGPSSSQARVSHHTIQWQGRKNISKSTLRSNVRTIPKGKVQNSRSAGRSRLIQPNNQEQTVQMQGPPNRVQLKKTIQEAVYRGAQNDHQESQTSFAGVALKSTGQSLLKLGEHRDLSHERNQIIAEDEKHYRTQTQNAPAAKKRISQNELVPAQNAGIQQKMRPAGGRHLLKKRDQQAIGLKKLYKPSASRAESVPPDMKNIERATMPRAVQMNQYSSTTRPIGRRSQPRGAEIPAQKRPVRGTSSQRLSDVQATSGVGEPHILESDRPTPDPIAATKSKNLVQQVPPGIISNQFSFKSIGQAQSRQDTALNSKHQHINSENVENLSSSPSRKNNGNAPKGSRPAGPQNNTGAESKKNFASLNNQDFSSQLQYFQSCDQQNLIGVLQKQQLRGELNPKSDAQRQPSGGQAFSRYGLSIEDSNLGNGPLKVSQVLGHMQQMEERAPKEVFSEMMETNDDKRVMQPNRSNKILVSQIIDPANNPNLMSINEGDLFQNKQSIFIDQLANFEKLKQEQQQVRACNETINSSNLVMNHRDRQNIKDFLSAHHSGVGLAALDLDTSALNQEGFRQSLGANQKDSQNINIISEIFETSQTLQVKQRAQQGKPVNSGGTRPGASTLEASYLKNTSANPLLNDSINRSQLSKAHGYNRNQGETSNLGLPERFNQRYLSDELIIEQNSVERQATHEDGEDQQRIGEELSGAPVEELVDPEISNPYLQACPVIEANNTNQGLDQIYDSQEGEEIVGEILSSDHDQTMDNQDVAPNLVKQVDLPSNKTNVKKLIPFKADDEDDEMIDQNDSNLDELDSGSGKAITKGKEPLQIKENSQIEHSIFIRQRARQSKQSQEADDPEVPNVGEQQSTSPSKRKKSHDPTPDRKIILSTNSTAVGKPGKDNLNNSKSTVSTLNPSNPNRKSTFLFGSRQGNMFTQNNLRYSQQNVAGGGVNILRMRSMALNQINEFGGANRREQGSEQKQANFESHNYQRIDELQNEHQNESECKYEDEQQNPVNITNEQVNQMSINSNPLSQNMVVQRSQAPAPHVGQFTIGEELLEISEKVSSDRDKLNDKITEQYAEEQDNTQTSQSQSRASRSVIANEVVNPRAETIQSIQSRGQKGRALENLEQIDHAHYVQKAELIKSLNSTPDQPMVVSETPEHFKDVIRKSNYAPTTKQSMPSLKQSIDSVMIQSMQSQQIPKKIEGQKKANEYAKQFESQSNFSQTESFKRNLIMSRQSMNNSSVYNPANSNKFLKPENNHSDDLEDSAGVLAKDLDNTELNIGGVLHQGLFSNYDIVQPKAGQKNIRGQAALPRIRFGAGKDEDSDTPEGLTQSKRSTPMHSDDEVTPRRGLDMMSESKMKGLEELAIGSFTGNQLASMNQSAQKMSTTNVMKSKVADSLDIAEDLNSRDLEASIIVTKNDLDRPTPDAQAQQSARKPQLSDSSSACNLLDSSRTDEEMKAQSSRRKGRYQDQSFVEEEQEAGPQSGRPQKTKRDLESIQNFGDAIYDK